MTPEGWRQIERLLQDALVRDPAERADFLDRACAGDAGLREELDLLLASQPAESFLASNALEDATMLLVDGEPDSALGRNFAHYFIEERLGAGGMSEVYLARDLSLGRKVALKLLDSVLAGDASSRARFLREARLAASLDHPNICTIHEVGEADGRPYIAMQYIEGETLRKVIGGHPLALDTLLSVMMQVAEALTAAHARGVVHRDIKSNNIIVTPQGRAKVLDFGIAKLLEKDGNAAGVEVTVTGQLLGTPSSMSPEQARGAQVDARTDVWSLGVVLYEMTTGRAPFPGETTNDVIALVLQGEPPPLSQFVPETPEGLQRIVKQVAAEGPERTLSDCGRNASRPARGEAATGGPSRQNPSILAMSLTEPGRSTAQGNWRTMLPWSMESASRVARSVKSTPSSGGVCAKGEHGAHAEASAARTQSRVTGSKPMSSAELAIPFSI